MVAFDKIRDKTSAKLIDVEGIEKDFDDWCDLHPKVFEYIKMLLN